MSRNHSPLWPNRQVKPPYGSVEVDWAHPLASKLRLCILGGHRREYARGYSLTGAETITGRGASSSVSRTIVFPAFLPTAPFTVFAAGKFNAANPGGTGGDAFSLDPSGINTCGVTTAWTTNECRIRVTSWFNGLYDGYVSPTTNLGMAPFAIGFAIPATAGQTVTVVANGTVQTAASGADWNPYTPAPWSQLGTSDTYASELDALYVIERGLSLSELRHLQSDPYCFFRPIIRRSYGWKTSGAAPSFKGYWVRRRSGLITPGGS